MKKNSADQPEKTLNYNNAGLSLLIMLSNNEYTFAESSVDTSMKKTYKPFNMLNSLSNVGLINQAHEMAKEKLAHLMVLYKRN